MAAHGSPIPDDMGARRRTRPAGQAHLSHARRAKRRPMVLERTGPPVEWRNRILKKTRSSADALRFGYRWLLRIVLLEPLQVFFIFHLVPVHTRFMQSKQRIAWDESPPYGQVSARTEAGNVKLVPRRQITLAANRLILGFVIGGSLSKGPLKKSIAMLDEC